MANRMEIVTFKVPRELLIELDELIKKGIFESRSAAIRYALAMLISNSYLELNNSR